MIHHHWYKMCIPTRTFKDIKTWPNKDTNPTNARTSTFCHMQRPCTKWVVHFRVGHLLFETLTYNPPSFSDTWRLFFTSDEKKWDGKKRNGKKWKETRRPAPHFIFRSSLPISSSARSSSLHRTIIPCFRVSFGLLIWTPELVDGGGIEELTIYAAPLVSLKPVCSSFRFLGFLLLSVWCFLVRILSFDVLGLDSWRGCLPIWIRENFTDWSRN